jgi:hypothetical protein
MKIKLNWMTLLALASAWPRPLPNVDTRRSRIEPPRPNQSFFYPNNTTNLLALCPDIIVDVEHQV